MPNAPGGRSHSGLRDHVGTISHWHWWQGHPAAQSAAQAVRPLHPHPGLVDVLAAHAGPARAGAVGLFGGLGPHSVDAGRDVLGCRAGSRTGKAADSRRVPAPHRPGGGLSHRDVAHRLHHRRRDAFRTAAPRVRAAWRLVRGRNDRRHQHRPPAGLADSSGRGVDHILRQLLVRLQE